MWRSNAFMYVTVPYNKVLFSILYFLTSQSEVDFGIALLVKAADPSAKGSTFNVWVSNKQDSHLDVE